MPVYFISEGDLRDRSVSVTGSLHRHLQASLRTQPGEELWLAVPSRRRFRVRVTQMDRRGLTADILEERALPPQRHPQVDLVLAILKGEKMDWVVQKSTELGVRSITPLLSERTIVRAQAARSTKQVERWQRIAHEAAQQAERWDIPQVQGPQTFEEFHQRCPDHRARVILCERSQTSSLSEVALPSEPAGTLALLVGPEGGWSPQEVETAVTHGQVPVSLGSRILRAETAALAALSILQSRLGNLG